jgi:hypothetical protein
VGTREARGAVLIVHKNSCRHSRIQLKYSSIYFKSCCHDKRTNNRFTYLGTKICRHQANFTGKTATILPLYQNYWQYIAVDIVIRSLCSCSCGCFDGGGLTSCCWQETKRKDPGRVQQPSHIRGWSRTHSRG